MGLEIKTADELLDREFEAKWADRRAVNPPAWALFRRILGIFIDRGGPVAVEAIPTAFSQPRDAVMVALTTLDEKDLILVREGRVELAYPFSAAPTPFTVTLPGGRARYAVCALDALGVPAMLGQRVTIRSRCHHCKEPLAFSATPDGLDPEAAGIMLWVGERGDIRQKACASL